MNAGAMNAGAMNADWRYVNIFAAFIFYAPICQRPARSPIRRVTRWNADPAGATR